MFVSTIIPTIGRQELTRAVQSVLEQSFDAAPFEVIVVNDSGRELDSAEWMNAPNVRILHTQRRRQGVARNTGAATAKGRYLHFLDDDDWLAPGALQQFWQAVQETDSEWVYGRAQLRVTSGERLPQLALDRSGNCAVQIMAGEWIPVGSYVIASRLFFDCGGFNSLATPGEDIALCRQAAMRVDFTTIAATTVMLERGDHSVTDYAAAWQRSRRFRERALNHPRAFARMRHSADSAYWHGKLARIYVTSALWNGRERQIAIAASRLLHAIAGILSAGRRLAKREFYRGLMTGHSSRTVW